jgi:spore germination cell wall hydrolase CwlJ-like protein
MKKKIYIPVVVILPLFFSQWPVNLLMTSTVYWEARGESFIGKIAVAHVIQNRVNDGRFGESHAGVILKPKQFSCFNSKEGRRRMRNPLKYNNFSSWKDSFEAVRLVLEEKVEDPTDGALWYYNPDLASPSWANKLKITKKIGHHIFLKEN